MIKAVIFDMDGVIVDSEPIWKQAEKEVFSSLGVKVTEELCKITQTMTTQEVTEFWFKRNPWEDRQPNEVENMVVRRVIDLIDSENCIIPGVVDAINDLKSRGIKLGLATNSPYKIIPTVLRKANLINGFEVISSSEFEKNGKPAPDVYIKTLQKLNESAGDCIVIEDSDSGIRAAKRAGLKVVAFTNKGRNAITEDADFVLETFDLNDPGYLEGIDIYGDTL